MSSLIPVETIEKQILLIREHKVLLDDDLAKLYNVGTKNLNKAVKRNLERFPKHFMFQLTEAEFRQIKNTSINHNWGGRRTAPYAFTEQGVAMLSSVLKSKRAIQVNIAIMDAFVKLREMIYSHKDLLQKINAMEKKYDRQFKIVFDALRELMNPIVPTKKHRIGF